MSTRRLGALRVALESLLPALEKKLAEAFGLRFGLTLGTLGESDAETLFRGAAEPLCVLRFRSQKAPCWLAWDSAAAVGAVETLLGARGAAPAARRLSPAEVKVASQLLAEIARAVAGAVGVAAGEFAYVQVASELGTWREAGAEAEAHRLDVQLDVKLGEQTSALHVYLAGVERGAEDARLPVPAALPGHLEHVEVELCACLPGSEISLDQLLALEAGDVIPLEARLGDPTTLSVEGLTLAHARLGSHRGRLAVRIESLSVQPEAAA